jgi:hypothetical protein
VLLVLRLLQIIPSYGTSPENWKAAAAYVLSARGGRPACVAFYPQDGRESFDYYLRSSATRQPGSGLDPTLSPVLPTLGWATVKPFVERYATLDGGPLAAVTSRCRQLFLVASHQGQSTGPVVSRANLVRYERLQGALAQRYPQRTVQQFGWASAVSVTRYSR